MAAFARFSIGQRSLVRFREDDVRPPHGQVEVRRYKTKSAGLAIELHAVRSLPHRVREDLRELVLWRPVVAGNPQFPPSD
jgi:hypothetical protein